MRSFVRKNRGFSMLAATSMLTAMAGVGAATALMLGSRTADTQQLGDMELLQKADAQIELFLLRNGRLPCPDTDSDGVENCESNQIKGAFPFLTLNNPTVGFRPGQRGASYMAYGIYRNENLDLGQLTERFEPQSFTDSEYRSASSSDLSNKKSLLDLCAALNQGDSLTNHALLAQGRAAAYGLALPGRLDADGRGSLYDGQNSEPDRFGTQYNAYDEDYDDLTLIRSFDELSDHLGCNSMSNTLDLAAQANDLSLLNQGFAENIEGDVELGLRLNATATAIAAFDMIASGAQVAGAAETAGKAAAALSLAIATCVPPFVPVGCPFIPITTASTVLAATGIGLATASLGAKSVALGNQILAVYRYDRLRDRTGTNLSSDYSVDRSADIADAQSQYNDADAEATSAEGAYQAELTAFDTQYGTALQTIRSNLNTELASSDYDAGKLEEVARSLNGYPVIDPNTFDPNDPPGVDEEDIQLGIFPALEALNNAKAALKASNEAAKSGLSFTLEDSEGNTVTAQDQLDDAQADYDAELSHARSKISEACSTLGPNETNCALSDNFENYLTKQQAAAAAQVALEPFKTEAEEKRDAADLAYATYKDLDCAAQVPSQAFDRTTGTCSGNSPEEFAAAKKASFNQSVCDSESATYSQAACNALTSNNTPPGSVVQQFGGMQSLIQQMDLRGAGL